jgi:hypothetical protein
MSSKIPTIDISALYSNDLKAKQEVPAQINSGYLWMDLRIMALTGI